MLTARIKNSTIRFEADRPIVVAIALDHEDVSSVVVLENPRLAYYISVSAANFRGQNSKQG